MLSLSGLSPAYRGILLALTIACGALVFVLLAVSDLNLVPLHNVQSLAAGGDWVIETRYNPLAILGLAVLAIAVLGGAALLLARPILSLTPGGRHALAGATLARELAGVLALLRSHLTAKEAYDHSLAKAQSRLAGLSDAGQVRTIVSLLVAENERMRRDSTGYQDRIADCAREIEALQSSLSGAEQAALEDPLTGTGNRRSFDGVMAKAVRDSNARATPLSLIMCDIDHFKRVNDVHGHQVGDEVIKLLARVIKGNIRETDTLARYGGEEFAVILPMTERDAAASIAERIRRQFEARKLAIRETKQKIGQLTASFGVAQHLPGDTADAFVQRADAKLYEAKARGRNRIEVSTSGHDHRSGLQR